MKIAVLGASGTGKTSMVAALRLALLSDTSLAVAFSVNEIAALEPADPYDFILLMGLDLPPKIQASDSRKTSASTTALAPEQTDAQLRQLLDQTAAAYTVVYGSGQARTDCALQAIDFQRKRTATRPASSETAWHWNCENCSDAACEHRLFSSLVKNTGESVRR